ncbi:MAG: protein kinase [Gemmatimonadaceae bacterium]
MAKKLKPGDTIRGYRVTKVFGPGMMAISYAAQGPSGEKILLKQYKSPAPTVVWYGPYVDYQQEVASRIRNGKVAGYAVRLVDAFEERWGGPCYFQAYEFISNGGELQQILDEEREAQARTHAPTPFGTPGVWERHVTWAKVLMAGIAALHEAKIVHCDLKPGNAFLIRDPSIGAGYQLKLIDTDFSLLADKRAPWHGYQGYVGTDNYRSPEHLTRGAIPSLASDIFTCGLILYELLAGTHPYWSDDQAMYAERVRAYAAKPPTLGGTMTAPADNRAVSAALHRCLSPDAAKRPTAAELRAALSGRTPGARPAAAAGATPAATGASGAAAAGGAAGIASARIRLAGGAGKTLDLGVRTELGKNLVAVFGDDSQFWDARQCVLERLASGAWQISPNVAAPNETLVNGDVLAAARPLRDGDVIAVGRKAKGIIKLPLTVRAL